ncbi:MAG: hypothetical protein KBG73_00640, partial [Candidatus Promineofilum sp.]|nr:hypothetical protein [Promineifilum sp.]
MNKRIVLIAILLLGLMAAAATVMAREALLEGERTTNRAGVTAEDMSALRGLLGRSDRRAAGLGGLFSLSAASQSDDNTNDNSDNANHNGNDDNANDNGDDDNANDNGDNANDNGNDNTNDNDGDDDNANDNGDDDNANTNDEDDNANDNDDDDND